MDALFRFSDEPILKKAEHHLSRRSECLSGSGFKGKLVKSTVPDLARITRESEDHFSQANAVRHYCPIGCGTGAVVASGTRRRYELRSSRGLMS
jgi:hypothetical protein